MTALLTQVDRGDTITSTVTFRDDSGVLTDPDVVTYYVQNPSGPSSEVSYVYLTDDEVTKSSTGVYVLTLPVTRSGEWNIRCVGEGAISQVERGVVRVVADPFS